MVNNIIKVALLVVILVLGYFIVESIMSPVRFKKAVDDRSKAVIQNLIDIRTAEMTYKHVNGKYTASFDTLIEFLKVGQIPVVKIIPDPKDTTYTRTIRDTIGFIPVIDSLFGKRQNFDVNRIKYVPFSENSVFNLDAGIVDKGGVAVNVFQAEALYKTFLKGLDNQMVVNLIATRDQLEKYPGLKVGSMTEASTDGNWE